MSATIQQIAIKQQVVAMAWHRDQYVEQELSDQAYLIKWSRMSTGMYYRAYTPGGRILDAGGGEAGHRRCRQACELHFWSGRRAAFSQG